MTNVPNNIREMWKDVYVLFDKHYLISNTEEAWAEFWDEAKIIIEKHNDINRVMELLVSVSDMIADRQKHEKTEGE